MAWLCCTHIFDFWRCHYLDILPFSSRTIDVDEQLGDTLMTFCRASSTSDTSSNSDLRDIGGRLHSCWSRLLESGVNVGFHIVFACWGIHSAVARTDTLWPRGIPKQNHPIRHPSAVAITIIWVLIPYQLRYWLNYISPCSKKLPIVVTA